MNDAQAIMPDEQEHTEDSEGRGWNGGEVHPDQAISTIAEESLPSPEAIIGTRPLGKVSGDGAFIDGDAEFEEFAVDSRRTSPVLAGHPQNQIAHFLGGARSPDPAAPGFSSPTPAEALAMPGNHSITIHNHQA